MSDIDKLRGINSEEIEKLRAANIKTVKDFLAPMDPDFNNGVGFVFVKTGIKRGRILELVPPEDLKADVLSDVWLKNLCNRVLSESPPDYPRLKRRRFAFNRFRLGLKGNWLGGGKNFILFVPLFLLLIIVALAWRSLGGFQRLSSPLALHDFMLIAADDMKSGSTPKASDFYLARLPPQSDYFRPDDNQNLDGLILARNVSGQMPLRFQDLLRLQVLAAKDIQANAIIQKEDVVQIWTIYQPGAALTLEGVCGHRARRAVHKDTIILFEFIEEPAK